MKEIERLIPFEYEMATKWTEPFNRMELRVSGNYFLPKIKNANVLLSTYMSGALRQVVDDNPNSEINISVKVVRDCCVGSPQYLLRIVFGDPSEHDKMEAYINM